MKSLKVTVAGGGPVGLLFALLLKDLIPEDSLSIKIYERRWCRNTKTSTVSWQSIIQGNARRQQVVTLQSKQYLQLPQAIQDKIFTEGSYSEMWPVATNSNKYRPRNVRIAHIEDVLLEIANQTECIELIPEKFNADEIDVKDQHLLVICEGSSSPTRQKFIHKFGAPNTSIYSLDGSNALEDAVLGLKVKSNLSDPETVILTVSQNRFLLNSLKGEGFLNVRLTNDEVKNVKGIKYDEKNNEIIMSGCVQSQPCLMRRSDDGRYRCMTHGSIFLPALVNDPLWGRILKALKLFNIKEENLEAVTLFKLNMSQTPRFTAQLYPPTENTPGTFGCLLGDAANAIHFWPGRGLNSGIDSLVSLARCIHSKWQNNSSKGEIKFRDADFLRHEGIMAMLQYRNKSRAWQSMVITEPDGSVRAIKDKIQNAIDESKASQDNNYDRDADINKLITRFTAIKNRLQGRIKGTLPSENELHQLLANIDDETLRILVVSNPWNTTVMAGEEVDVDLLFEQKNSPTPEEPSSVLEQVEPVSKSEEFIKKICTVERDQKLDILSNNRNLVTRESQLEMEKVATLVQNLNTIKLPQSARKEFRLSIMSDSTDLTIINEYHHLENCLKHHSWKEADAITEDIILKILSRERQGYLDLDTIRKLSYKDLHTTNNLWVYYSKSQFGFGIQKIIWDKVKSQANNDKESYNKFCQTIGWLDENNKLLTINYDINAPKGHLPSNRTGIRLWTKYVESALQI